MNSPARKTSPQPWFDWTALCWALVLAFAASLPLLATVRERRDFYLFEVTIRSSISGLTRVSWDAGRGFNENDSSAQPITASAEKKHYFYLLPTGTLRALRLNPIDRAARVAWQDARIVDRRGKTVRAFGPTDFQAGQGVAVLRIDGHQVEIDTSPAAGEASLDLALDRPVELPLEPGLLWRVARPVFVPVFLLGLLLSSPWVVNRLGHLFSPASRWAVDHPVVSIALISVSAVLLQAYPVAFFGRSFVSPNNGSSMLYGQLPTLPGYQDPLPANTMGSDVGALFFHHLYIPMVQREALFEHGEWPLWNRYNLSGAPLLGQGQSMAGDPFNLITILANGASWAWDLHFLLSRFVFALGLGLCVRGSTRGLGGAVAVAGAAPFIGYFLFRINHPANFTLCASPWILWAWIGYVRTASRRAEVGWLVALLTANWLVLTSGTVKEAYMSLACLNWAGVVVVWVLPDSRGRRGRLLGQAVVSGILFVLMTAPLWGPFLVTLGHAFTVYDKPAVQTLPAAQLIGFFDEIFYRQGGTEERVVAPALNFFYLLGLLWWWSRPQNWLSERGGLALLIAGILPFGLAFGFFPSALLLRIPFIGKIYHLGNTFSCPLLVLTAVLAGCGFQDALRCYREEAPVGRRSGVVLGILAGLVAVYLTSTSGQPKSLFFAGYAAALGLAAVSLCAALCWRRSAVAAVALGLALPLLLWRHGQATQSSFNKYVFTPGIRTDFFAPSPAIAALEKARGQPTRLIGLNYTLFPTYNVALRWESLYGVDALRSRPYEELTRAFGLVRVMNWELPNELGAVVPEQPFHDLLNVGYYLTDPGTPRESLGSLRPLAEQDLDCLVSPTVWPRAFFSDQLATYRTVEEFVAQVRRGDGRPFAAVERTQLEGGELPAHRTSRVIQAATGYHLTSNSTAFTIEAPSAGVAVLTEAFFPEDFEVSINEKPAAYFRVNHAFKGVLLPEAGTYRIHFTYWPKHFTAMLGVSACGILGIFFGGAWMLAAGAAKKPE